MYKSGDIILVNVQYTDTYEVKKRPGLILYEEFNNYVVAGITSNKNMNGIPLLKSEGAVKNSVIKLNYIFTVSSSMIIKKLFTASTEKKRTVCNEIKKKLIQLK